jgi:hypothetical protein
MKTSKSGDEITAKVEYVSDTRIWLRYEAHGGSFRIELPKTSANSHLKLRDTVEMALLFLK